jgi:hypothetical protein
VNEVLQVRDPRHAFWCSVDVCVSAEGEDRLRWIISAAVDRTYRVP